MQCRLELGRIKPDAGRAPPGFYGWESGLGCQARIPSSHPFRIALDTLFTGVDGQQLLTKGGSKDHSGCVSLAAMLEYLEWRRSNQPICNHYEVLSACTHLFFDFERPFSEQEQLLTPVQLAELRHDITSAVMRHLGALVTSMATAAAGEAAEAEPAAAAGQPSSAGTPLQPGTTCQVAVSVYNIKYSCHLVAYMPHGSCNPTLAGVVACILNARLVALPPSDPDHALLVYLKDGTPTSVVDDSVYHEGRCFRMLHNTKRIYPDSPLLPYLGSSDKIADHLVNSYVELESSRAAACCLPPIDPSHVADQVPALPPRTQSCIGAVRRIRASASAPPETGNDIVPAWQPGDLAHVRTNLLANEELATTLHVKPGDLQFSYETTRSGRMSKPAPLMQTARQGRGRLRGLCAAQCPAIP